MLCWLFELAEYTIVAVLVIQLVRFVLADADLTLLWYEHFGKKTESLGGKVVWITGASSGIGEYLAYDLAKASCRLVLSARRKDELERVKQQCLVHGRVKEDDILILPLDLQAFDAHANATNKVLEKFKVIDILVNNGGRSQRGWAHETALQVDKEIMDLNYLGTLSLTKAVLPHMIQRKCGHIVVTSSISGKAGAAFSAAYSGTKFALHGWFDTLRLEQSPNNINVSVVCPGPIVSNVVEQAFSQKPDEAWGKSEVHTKMSTERCSELMAVAIANKLDEVWISIQPALFFLYLSQYMPRVALYIKKNYRVKAILKIRDQKK